MKKFFLIPLLTMLCTVMAWGGVAKIGTTEYETLNDAFAAAKNGDAIELLEDVTVTSVIPVKKNLTLHMFGHKITNNVSNNRAFRIYDATFTIVGNADGISANASMEIPDSNFGSFGFIDFRSTSNATTGKERLVVYNVDFEGATAAGAFFMLRANNQSIKLQDVNVICEKGINNGVPKDQAQKWNNWTVGDNYSIVNGNSCQVKVELIRGTYNYDSYNPSAGVFQAGIYSGTIIDDQSTIVMDGVTVNTTCGPILEGHGNVTYTNCQFNIVDQYNHLQSSVAAAMGGEVTVNSGNFVGQYAAYIWNSGGTININGGNFVSVENGAALCADAQTEENSIINVYGGNFNGKIRVTSGIVATSDINIMGGKFENVTFEKSGSKASINITGGTFSGTAITAESLANYVDTENGYIIAPNTDGSFTVTQQQSTVAQTDIVWQNDADWSAGETPNTSTEVTVAANQTVTVGVENPSQESDYVVAEAKSIALAPNSELVIKSGSTLIVGDGGITGTGSGASDAKITVEAGGQLLIDPAAEQHPYGTVIYKSVAKVDGDYEGGHIWEQIGVPTMGNPSVEATEHAAMYFNVWDPTNGWVALSDYSQFNTPFKGYNFTNASNVGNVVYTFKGQLVGNQQQALDFPRDGYSFFANSYTGPIDIVTLLRQFETGSDVQRGVYLYDPLQEQYLSINEHNAGQTIFGKTYPSEIKPMQAFYIYSHATTSGTASYEDLVWTPARAALSNAPYRQAKMTNSGLAIKLTAENGRSDNTILTETANSDLNNYKMMNPSKSVNIYAVSENGNMANFATDDINNTFIGFTTNGSESYTLSFDAVNGEYALRDMYTGETLLIENGMEYAFEAMPNGKVENRFQIVKAPKVTTGVDQVLNDVLCTKVIENGVLYIIKDGVKYNAQGALVK